MANRRVITSNIFEDEFFGEQDMMGRLLWIGLFTRCADDQGRLVDNPMVIRSQVFPYDDIPVQQIDGALKQFAEQDKIIRYKDERGRGYIQLVKWWENQNPQWAMPSKYPAPEGWADRIRSYIKGVYNCQNWPESSKRQSSSKDNHLDEQGGQASLPTQVGEHDPDHDPVINPDHDPDPEKKIDTSAPQPVGDKQPREEIDRVQLLVERKLGAQILPGDIPIMRRLETLGVEEVDFDAGLTWWKENVGGHVRGLRQFQSCLETAIKQRVQASAPPTKYQAPAGKYRTGKPASTLTLEEQFAKEQAEKAERKRRREEERERILASMAAGTIAPVPVNA